MQRSRSCTTLHFWMPGFLAVAALGASCGSLGGGNNGGSDTVAEVEDVDSTSPGLEESAVYPEDAWRHLDNVVLPQSQHPYANNAQASVELAAAPCAEAVRLTFSRVELRSGDTLSLYSADGRRQQRITSGNRLNFKSNAIPGNTVKFTLRSNASGQGWGYEVTGVDVVESRPVCPRRAWRDCAQDQVPVPQPTPLCGCPREPVCVPMDQFTAEYGAGGGFTGGYSGQVLKGNGEIVRIQQRTAGDQREETLIGFANNSRVRNLASELHALAFFDATLPNTAGNVTVNFKASLQDRSAVASWPMGQTPELFQYAVPMFNKAVTCGDDPEDAVCASGHRCEGGSCVAAPACSCARLEQPVCGVHDNTFGNPCLASCAGEDIKHLGACGLDGDVCGGARELACQEGFACTFEGGETSPAYARQAGSCQVEAGNGCVCPALARPVCGTNNTSYSNPCAAACAQVEIQHDGLCGQAGDSCGGRRGLTCLEGLHCEFTPLEGVADLMGSCVADAPVCSCTEEFQPVCDRNGVTHGNACAAGCAGAEIAHDGACGQAGDTCGTIRGLACQDGFKCRYAESTYEAPFPDAGGSCVPYLSCDAPSECGLTARIACPHTWYCEAHACRFECNAPEAVWTRQDVLFETAHPYANSKRQGWTATGDATATAVRFVFSSFITEQTYDVVTISDEGWNELARYSGNLGAFTSVEVPGRVAHVVFTSDRSVVKAGFVGVAVEFKH